MVGLFFGTFSCPKNGPKKMVPKIVQSIFYPTPVRSARGYIPLDGITIEWVGRKEQFITVASRSISTKKLKFHPQIFPVYR